MLLLKIWPMLIRTALLCVPTFDEAAISVVRQLLHERLPTAVIIQVEQAAGERNLLEERLRRWCDEDEIDLVLTSGGTLPAPGPSRHQWVPEATQAVSERLVPGLAEAMRTHAAQESPLAWLERGVAGIRGRSLVLNLPAGAAAAFLYLDAVIALLPPLFAHLQEDPAAPRLADELDLTFDDAATTMPDSSADESSAMTTPASSSRSTGLNAEEFAAFLQRHTKSG